jgi:hypothetical protein
VNARQLVEAETDRFQGILNKAYSRWQKGGEHENKDMTSFVNALEEPERMATVLGKFNQQVTNGGVRQWVDNGYADAQWPHLLEYAKQFANTENGKKFARTIQALSNVLEDADSDSWEEAFKDNSDSLRDAIMSKDWAEVDRILGGTDLDERRFRLAMDEEIRNNLSVNPIGPSDDGKWKYQLVIDDGEDGPIVVYDSASEDEYFDSEESADDEGSQKELGYRDIDDDDVLEKIEDKVLNDLADEYARHANRDFHVDRIDKEYYAYNDAWIAELEQYFQTNYPDTLFAKLKKALQGGAEAVQRGVKAAGDKVRDFGQRVGRAATAAQKAFRGESAKKVVNAVLSEGYLVARSREDGKYYVEFGGQEVTDGFNTRDEAVAEMERLKALDTDSGETEGERNQREWDRHYSPSSRDSDGYTAASRRAQARILGRE